MKLTKAQVEGLKKLEAGNFEVANVDCYDSSKVFYKTGVSSAVIKGLEKKGAIKFWAHVLGGKVCELEILVSSEESEKK